jgi:hypothetical protein
MLTQASVGQFHDNQAGYFSNEQQIDNAVRRAKTLMSAAHSSLVTKTDSSSSR